MTNKKEDLVVRLRVPRI